MDPDFAQRVAEVAALADPLRRELYLFVAGQSEPVSRDRASEGVGVARHTAKFHLDKLVEQGLLDVDFRRLSGRQGPGAGRPTKLYRRSARQMSVILPERLYDLAGQLMADAIAESTRTGRPVLVALHAAAAALGATLGDQVRQDPSPPDSGGQVKDAYAVLNAYGYEPRLADKNTDPLRLPGGGKSDGQRS